MAGLEPAIEVGGDMVTREFYDWLQCVDQKPRKHADVSAVADCFIVSVAACMRRFCVGTLGVVPGTRDV